MQLAYTSGSQLGILSPRGHAAIFGDIFGYHNWNGGGFATYLEGRDRDAAQYPTTQRTTARHTELCDTRKTSGVM